MNKQLRVVLTLAVLALAAGWLGLRRGNQALEQQLGPGVTTASPTVAGGAQ